MGEELKFKQWNGKERGIFYEEDEFFLPVDKLMETETGGVALAKLAHSFSPQLCLPQRAHLLGACG